MAASHDLRHYRRLKTPRERPSHSLIVSAAIVGGMPGLIPLIASFFVGGAASAALILVAALWIGLQAFCGVAAFRAPRWLAVLLPSAIATLMLLLGPLLFFELGPLYLWPGSVLWYVVAFRDRGEVSILPNFVYDAIERVRRAGE